MHLYLAIHAGVKQIHNNDDYQFDCDVQCSCIMYLSFILVANLLIKCLLSANARIFFWIMYEMATTFLKHIGKETRLFSIQLWAIILYNTIRYYDKHEASALWGMQKKS